MGNFNRDDDGSNDPLSKRVLGIMLAAFISMLGTQGYIYVKPDTVRPNPYDSLMAEADQEEMKEWVNLRLKEHDAHLKRANAGWDLINDNHTNIEVMKKDLEHVRRALDTLLENHDD